MIMVVNKQNPKGGLHNSNVPFTCTIVPFIKNRDLFEFLRTDTNRQR